MSEAMYMHVMPCDLCGSTASFSSRFFYPDAPESGTKFVVTLDRHGVPGSGCDACLRRAMRAASSAFTDVLAPRPDDGGTE